MAKPHNEDKLPYVPTLMPGMQAARSASIAETIARKLVLGSRSWGSDITQSAVRGSESGTYAVIPVKTGIQGGAA